MNAPIALFVYNRLDHTQRTVESLKKNIGADQSTLLIFSDGPKNKSDFEKIKILREYLKTISGFGEINFIEREKNLGLAESIITGVTEVVNQFGKIIVLEDDMLTSPYFLTFMNEALDKYEHETKVCAIHGYAYPEVKSAFFQYFLRMSDCWGWATWQDRWALFQRDGYELLTQITNQKLVELFDFEGSANYLQMLKEQILGLNNSWAIRWYASTFLKNKLGLFPSKSLVRNIGTDGSGQHCQMDHSMDIDLSHEKMILSDLSITEDQTARKQLINFFNEKIKSPGMLDKIKKYPVYLLPKILIKKIRNFILENDKAGYFGNYRSWEEVKNISTGYEHNTILNAVEKSLQKVKRGKAAFERDSVLFYQHEYSQPLTQILKDIAGSNSSRLSVLDFGGSLGSLYYQNKNAFSNLDLFEWCIVEQDSFFLAGKKQFEDGVLHFYRHISDCLNDRRPDVLLLSSVLSYLENPFHTLESLLAYNFKWIIIDRTLLMAGPQNRLTLQKVPPSIYDASYPCWIICQNLLLNFFAKQYNLKYQFNALGGVIKIKPDHEIAAFKGFLFEHK